MEDPSNKVKDDIFRGYLNVLRLSFCVLAAICAWAAYVANSSIAVIGSAISLFGLCYGAFKSWGHKEAEGVFGGKLLLAGAFSSNQQRWNWSVDLVLIGFGLGSASIVQGDKHAQQYITGGFYFILLFSIAYAFIVSNLSTYLRDKVTIEENFRKKKEKAAELGTNAILGIPSSVYVDPASLSASLVFQVFVPQMILMTLYTVSLFRHVPNNSQSFTFAILGAFFNPVTFVAADIPQFICDYVLCHWFQRLQKEDKLNLICLKDGKPAPRLTWFPIRATIHVVVNLIFPSVVLLTLPFSLASSSSPSEFVFNAMAIIYVIQLDNIPASQRDVYVFSEPMEP